MRPSLSSTHRPLRWILATVFAAATVFYCALWMVAVRYATAVELGFDSDYLPEDQAQLITTVLPGSPAERAGMQPGDRLVAINGHALADTRFQERTWARHQPGDHVRLTIERPGQATRLQVDATFRQRVSRSSEGGLTAYVAGQVRNTYPVPFVLVGLAVLFLRLDDPNAWLLALIFAGFTATPGFPGTIEVFAPGLRPFTRAYQATLLSFLPPLFFFFFARFPARSPIDRRVPWLKWVGLAAGALAAVSGWSDGGMRLPPQLTRWLGEAVAQQIIVWWALGTLALGLASLATTYLYAPDGETRRKTRVIFWGTTVGLAPSLLSVAIETALGFREPDWLATLRVVFAFGIPLSLAYAVVKHRVLEIPVLLQRSARYLLVQRGFTIVLTLLSIAVTLAFASSLAPALAPLVDVAQPSGIALGAVFGTVLLWSGSLVHRHVSERIDRAFFRRAYDARMILVELADRARGVTGRAELAALLHRKVATALQPRWLAVYFAEPGDRLTAMAGAVPQAPGSLSAVSQGFADLVERGGPVEASLRPVHQVPGQDPLAPLDPDYLVPLVGRNRRLLGLLVLGARLSDEPYSGEDANLLSLVAGQAALALENFSLAEQIADRLEAERRQAHEIAIAQEVQQQLLPQRLPALATVEYAGLCTQARSVGGDYYDFLDLGPGRVGFVLADISGKGIAAALLMANLQAMVRSRYALAVGDHEALLRSINETFLDSTAPNRFATMFFAKYDDASRQLTYVNCGHNPPLLVRDDGGAEWLPATAAALGFSASWTCASGSRRLGPGDTLVMYSDGITEAWSASDEEYGEGRLLDVVLAHRRLPAAELAARIVGDVRSFSTLEQSDDWTLIIARVR